MITRPTAKKYAVGCKLEIVMYSGGTMFLVVKFNNQRLVNV